MSDSLMPIMERGEAMALGLKKYFTGRPCIRGHFAERYIRGTCVKCNTESVRADRLAGKHRPRARKCYEKNTERYRAKAKTWKKNNPGKVKEINRRSSERAKLAWDIVKKLGINLNEVVK